MYGNLSKCLKLNARLAENYEPMTVILNIDVMNIDDCYYEY